MGKRLDVAGGSFSDVADSATRRYIAGLTQAVKALLGTDGGSTNRAITIGELKSGGLGGGTTIIQLPGGPGSGETTEPDLTPPPTPTWHGVPGFDAAAGLTTIVIQWDAPTYTQGHGHAQTNIYGAKWPAGSAAPTFANAVLLMSAYGPAQIITSLGTELGTRWCLWMKWQSVDGVESITPAGGTNGIVAQSGLIDGHDLSDLLIEARHLADGSVTGTKLAAQAVDLTKFANNIQPITFVTALPTTYVTQYVCVPTGQLYRWNGAEYIPLVNTADISGQVQAAQIAALEASKLTGQIVATQITDGAISTPKLAAGAVTTAALAAGSVQAGNIAAGAVTTDSLAAGAITAEKIGANEVTAGKVAAGAIGVQQLAAGAVTAKSLAVTDLTNLCFNGQGRSLDGWVGTLEAKPSDAGIRAYWQSVGVSSDSALHFRGRDCFFGPLFDVAPGDDFFVSADLSPSGGGTAGYPISIGLMTVDEAGITPRFVGAVGAAGVGHSAVSGTTGALQPSSAQARIWVGIEDGFSGDFSGNRSWYATNIRVLKRNAGKLIVDGSITANHLAANSIAVGTAAIQAGAISNAMIGNEVVDNSKISNLAAAKLTAGDGTIGGNLKSANYASGSAGWIMTPGGYLEVTNGIFRGSIYAGAGSVGGILLNGSNLYSSNWNGVDNGFAINANGNASFYNITARGTIYATGGTFAGALVAATGTFAGSLSAATGTFSGSLAANTVTTNSINAGAVTKIYAADGGPDDHYIDLPFTVPAEALGPDGTCAVYIEGKTTTASYITTATQALQLFSGGSASGSIIRSDNENDVGVVSISHLYHLGAGVYTARSITDAGDAHGASVIVKLLQR